MPSISSPVAEAVAGLIGDGRQAFLPGLSQHARLLSIETSLPPGALLVEQFDGSEAMSRLFRFEIDCLATAAHYALQALVGEEVSLRLRLADGGTRAFHGMVDQVRHLGSDGALTRYRLTLLPWLHGLSLRRDSYVFQDMSVLDIVEDILKDYPYASYRFDVKTALPRRSVTMQYRESDYAFILRLLAEEGLSFFFEHADEAVPGNGAGNGAPPHARHRLVIVDDNAALLPCAQPSIRFHRAAAPETSDTVTQFAQGRQVQPNAVALASWDYKTLAATAAEDQARTGIGAAPPLEIHEGGGAYRYTDAAEGARIARARAEALALAHQTTRGSGSVRALAPGTWFALTDHAEADGAYVVLSVRHQAANNLPAGITALAPLAEIERGTYRNTFSCVPRATPVRPGYWLPKPQAPGPQVALVVGVEGEEITSERDHRVKVQFPWQRGERPAPGQSSHPARSNAPGNERAGTWVRVAERSAGANWGANFVPRIGQEVAVQFVAGDIDRPLVSGHLYNGVATPPFHGADNHPGALTGIQSKEYAADGFNQWVIDDTPGQLRQSVLSTYAASQLHLGYLIRQDGNTRGRYRGTGFELASDAWGTLRAGSGLLVSTAQRGEAMSTQMDTREAQGKLTAAAELAGALSDAAVQHRTPALSTAAGVKTLVKTVADTDSADGETAPKFAQPVALFDSAAGIGLTTPASGVMLAGQDLTLTAMSALRMTAGQAVTMVSAKRTSLFTHAGGAKVIAAKAPVSLRAHTGPMDVVADKAMTLTSSNGHIRVQAKQEVLLAAGGGYIRLSGGNVDIHCPASISVMGSSHDFMGPGSVTAALPRLPDTRVKLFDEAFVLKDQQSGKPLTGVPYRIKLPDGSFEEGITDAQGHTHVVRGANSGPVEIQTRRG